MGVTWNAAPPKLTMSAWPATQMTKMMMKNLLANMFLKTLRLLSMQRELYKRRRRWLERLHTNINK